MAIVAPSEEGVVPWPPPFGTASAPNDMSDVPAPPPSLPQSLADTQPFVVDLENQAASPHAHPPLSGGFPPALFASPPPSPSNSVARPCLLRPSSPSVRSAVARSPGPSPGTSSASWSVVPPLPPTGSVSASAFAPRSRWLDGTLSAAYRPRGFGPMVAHPAVPPPLPPLCFVRLRALTCRRRPPRLSGNLNLFRLFPWHLARHLSHCLCRRLRWNSSSRPLPHSLCISPAFTLRSLPHLKRTNSTLLCWFVGGSSCLNSVRRLHFTQKPVPPRIVIFCWTGLPGNSHPLRSCGISMPGSTGLRFADWLTRRRTTPLRVCFRIGSNRNPVDRVWLRCNSVLSRGLLKPPGSPSSRSASAPLSVRPLRLLPTRREHRESLPLSLSFVLHLEKSVLDPISSPAEVLRLGYLLLCIWGSLRWGDALWCPPSRLHYQPQSHALVGICLRTKTTKRGMPFGVLAAGLSGTTSQCWSLRFLSVLRQSVADTLAINPNRHLDFSAGSLVWLGDSPHYFRPLEAGTHGSVAPRPAPQALAPFQS